MKIDSTTTTVGNANGATRTGSSVTRPAADAATDVHLSELAAQLQFSGEAPPFDASRVADIKQAIAEGRFTINAEAIADRLIASASELVSSQRQA